MNLRRVILIVLLVAYVSQVIATTHTVTHEAFTSETRLTTPLAPSDASASVAPVARYASMTLGEALMLMRANNTSLKLASGEVEAVRNERKSVNSAWYPSIGVSGGWAYMSNPIEVRQSLSVVTEPIEDVVKQVLPDDVVIGPLLEALGGRSLAFPLAPRGVMSVDATLVWPVFAGGKRLFAGRLGRELERGAEVARGGVDAEMQVRLVECYYAVALSERVCEVRRRSVRALERHLHSARKMHAEGVIGVTELLMVEVAAEDAQSQLLTAENNVLSAQAALRMVLGVDTTDIRPVTPMFVSDSLPDASFFRSRIEDNYLVRGLSHGISAADLRLRMSRGGYAPTIALLGKQTLYSRGINKHLMPRTIIGVGVTWTLFDGFKREHEIGSARLAAVNSRLARSGALDQVSESITRLLTELRNAEARIRSGRRAVALNLRVLDNRRREWEHGVTTIDLVADAEVALATSRVGVLTAYYAYDVALMGLLAVCGIPEMFYELAAGAVQTPE